MNPSPPAEGRAGERQKKISMIMQTQKNARVGFARRRCFWLAIFCWASVTHCPAGSLEDYVAKPDASFHWRKLEQRQVGALSITHLELTSQTWKDSIWTHQLQVVRPTGLRNPDIAFLLVSGDGDGARQMNILQTLAQRAGALAAVVTSVPNQPLYDGRKEDALIAFTFQKFIETGDDSWPLLFPMVKSAVRAMDTVQAFAGQEYKQKIERFVVSGASKRGWTTWLTAAVDTRVKGMAPMVIDMLNMKAQLAWMNKVYGHQSEMIHDYTSLQLHERIDEPRVVLLRKWVDPYSYCERYHMPKLLLLGSNDPYWTVDSLRHYWSDLPEPKLLFQTPNAGHDLAGGREALPALAAFFQMIADRQPLPKVEWKIKNTGDNKAVINIKTDQHASGIRLWTALSTNRDFRMARWSSTPLPLRSGSTEATAEVTAPSKGFKAFLVEISLTAKSGQTYKLSTEARVVPDSIKP